MEASTSSETPNKRVKLSSTLDPFQLINPDVFDLILQHFGFKDLLKASLTSRLWFGIIGDSRKWCEKVMIKIVGPRTAEESTNFLNIKLTRKYKKISMERIQHIIPDVLSVIDGQTFKEVTIDIVTFETKNEMEKVLRAIEPNVEVLEINFMEVKGSADVDVESYGLRWPKLKNLWLNWMYIPNLFTNLFSLERLNNKWVTPFKLEIFFFRLCVEPVKIYDELYRFIESHADSLKTLSLSPSLMNRRPMETAFNLPKLKEFNLYGDSPGITDWHNVKLNPSHCIETFGLLGGFFGGDLEEQDGCLEKILQSLPALKTFKIPRLTDSRMLRFGHLLRKVEHLLINYIGICSVRKGDFPNIKSIKPYGISAYCLNLRLEGYEQIEEQIRNKSPDQRTKFEKLILAIADKQKFKQK